MENLDSDQMCELIMIGDYAEYKDKCEHALKGVLNNGISNAFAFMYQ
jgi:hypothetical protein